MANYSTLKASVNAYIKANGVRAITGPVLNGILTQMINTLGDGARYGGIATPSGNPGTPDNVVFFVATAAGTYTNYGGFTLDGKTVHVLVYDGSWTDVDTGAILAPFLDTAVVGSARNLAGSVPVTDSFMERTTGGDAEVANGIARLTEVAGKSRVWNQLVPTDLFPNSGTSADVDFTTNTDGSITAVGTASALASFSSSGVVNITAGHKYLLLGSNPSNDLRLNVYNPTIFGSGGISAGSIATAIASGQTTIRILVTSGATVNDAIYPEVFDLTLLGIDNLTTVAEIEAWLAENIGLKSYYDYNAGEVLNNKMLGIESIGRNLLDPSTGKARIVGKYSDVYGNYYGITGSHGALTFTSDLGETSTITPDSDGKFQLETPGWLEVATPGDDCAVFLWWDGTKTDYVAYERNVANFDAVHIYGRLNGEGERVQVFPDGMAAVGAKDVVRLEDGAPVARKRVGRRAYASGDESDASVVTDGSTYTYYALDAEQVYTDLVYMGSDIFEDGTPVTLPVQIAVDNWGIERVLPQNDEAIVTAAPELSIVYDVDAVEQLDTIKTSGVFVEDLKANLSAVLAVINQKLETAMGGTISLGDEPVNKVYPVIFTPSAEPESEPEGEGE